MAFLSVVGVAGVVVGGGDGDGGLLDGKGAVRIEREAVFDQIFGMSFVVSDREADEPLVDEPVAKGWAEEVGGDQTPLLHVLDMQWLLQEDVCVALKMRVEKSMSSRPVVAFGSQRCGG